MTRRLRLSRTTSMRSSATSSSSAASGSSRRGRRHDRGDRLDHRAGDGPRPRGHARTTSTAPSPPPARRSTAWSQVTADRPRRGAAAAIAAGLAARGRRDRRADRARGRHADRRSRPHDPGRPAGDVVRRRCPQVIERDRPGRSRSATRSIVREPVGVVGAITPWNYPLHQICAKVAPALAAGCTVVVKPSEVTPLNAFMLAEIIEEVGLPAGVFNLVHRLRPGRRRGDRGAPGRRHGLVHRLDRAPASASREVARRNRQARRARARRQVAERDPRRRRPRRPRSSHGVSSCFLNSGQTCTALTRMLVPARAAAEAEAIAAAVAEQIDGRRPVRARRRPRAAGLGRPARARARLHPQGQSRRARSCVAGGAEPPEGLEQRLLRAADRLLRRDART